MKLTAEVELVINLTMTVRSLRLFTRRMWKGLELWALKPYSVVRSLNGHSGGNLENQIAKKTLVVRSLIIGFQRGRRTPQERG